MLYDINVFSNWSFSSISVYVGTTLERDASITISLLPLYALESVA